MVFMNKTFALNVSDSAAGPADYTVSSDAEWDAVMANSAATLDGKVMETAGTSFSHRVIDNKSFSTGFTIRSASGSSIPSIELTGTVSNLSLDGISLQGVGWPGDTLALIRFGTGTFDNFAVRNSTIRHGYGASLVDVDMTADYPEYDRVDNVQTATTTSATYVTSWKDNIATTNSRLQLFNRGADTVYFEAGGSGVVATTSSTPVAPGALVYISGLNPLVDTHFAVLAASGSQEVNARSEIGLVAYMANAMAASGSSVFTGDFSFIGNTVTDVNNGIKAGVSTTGTAFVADNVLRRVYQDQFAGIDGALGTYVVRNIWDGPFARSGRAESQNGDANDPHGDAIQLFGDGSATISNVTLAGNRQRSPAMRAGVSAQGAFISDNDTVPSYENFYIVSEAYTGGAPNGIVVGEVGSGPYPAEGVFVYGVTAVDADNLSSSVSAQLVVSDGESAYIDSSIFGSVITNNSAGTGEVVSGTSLELNNYSGAETTYFPNWADLPSADTRADIDAALTTTGAASGIGSSASASVIDWTTTDLTSVVKWDLLPSGAGWSDLIAQPISTLVSLPLHRIMNRKPSQPVVAGSGTEWRSTQSDKTTQIQAWTTASGTIEPDEYIQIRSTTSASPNTTTTAEVTINGVLESVSLTTEITLANAFVTNGAWFTDTVNLAAGTSILEWEAKYKMPTAPGSDSTLLVQTSGSSLLYDGSSNLRTRVEDSTNAQLYSMTNGPAPSVGAAHTVNYKVDLTTDEITVTIDGIVAYNDPLTTASSGEFASNKKLGFASNGAGGVLLPTDTEVEYFKVWRTTGGTRTLHKEISVAAQGSIAGINSDAWTTGTVTAA